MHKHCFIKKRDRSVKNLLQNGAETTSDDGIINVLISLEYYIYTKLYAEERLFFPPSNGGCWHTVALTSSRLLNLIWVTHTK